LIHFYKRLILSLSSKVSESFTLLNKDSLGRNNFYTKF